MDCHCHHRLQVRLRRLRRLQLRRTPDPVLSKPALHQYEGKKEVSVSDDNNGTDDSLLSALPSQPALHQSEGKKEVPTSDGNNGTFVPNKPALHQYKGKKEVPISNGNNGTSVPSEPALHQHERKKEVPVSDGNNGAAMPSEPALHSDGNNGTAVHSEPALHQYKGKEVPVSDGNNGTGAPMDRRLLQAAVAGDARSMKALTSDDPDVLLGKTPQGNNCLHIACFHGHEEFCRDVLVLNPSLLAAVNTDGETPLFIAVTRGHTSLASFFLGCCRARRLGEVILKQDTHGCNVLHHAIRSGHRELALELIAAVPALSQVVNKYNESPMFIAVMRNYADVFEKLLGVPDSTHVGPGGQNALHAAVRNDNSVLAKKIVEARPEFLRQENDQQASPVLSAVLENKTDVLRVLLEHDSSLGHVVSSTGWCLLCWAAYAGHVDVARVILQHCPDAPYQGANQWTCLHEAVRRGHTEFVKFVVQSQELRKLVNMRDINGKTALECLDMEVRKRNPKLVAALMLHQDRGITVINNSGAPMDKQLLQAAMAGDAGSMKALASHDPAVLLGTTPQRNTCLHIACVRGHEAFCKQVLVLNASLLTTVNANGDTPLLTAVTSGHTSLASFFLGRCREQRLGEVILKQDRDRCNALHHAIRSGHRELAKDLIAAEPALSRAVNRYDESPMFIAVMRNYTDVFEKLLEVPGSAHVGTSGSNALHAAVRNGNSDVAEMIVKARPELAREESLEENSNPLRYAAIIKMVDVLRVLLKHDSSLGHVISSTGWCLLGSAAYAGHVDVARVILQHCPDAPYQGANQWTCLHEAVRRGHTEFVKFVVQSQELRKLVNMRNRDGDTPLHIAVQNCNPKMVAALLRYQHRDVTVLNNKGIPAMWAAIDGVDYAKTLNWNEVSMLMLKADPIDAAMSHNLQDYIKTKVIEKSRTDVKSLTETYTRNTSVVAILIASITFAAAFNVSKAYSSDAESHTAIVAMKMAFLISDTLAMCSSFLVVFICIIIRWEDLEFLLYYRSLTKKLMWFAYIATTMAFATGLYITLAPHVQWLAIVICIVSFLLPILTLIGEWPVPKVRFRSGQNFKSELLDMV